MRGALFAALLASAPAFAQPGYPLPTLFDVSSVGPGDALNVRAAPGTGAEIVGTLQSDARGVEVVELDASGQWGQINTGERAGWVAMRFLAPQPDVWQGDVLPAGLGCFGTEPFWSVEIASDRVVLSAPDATDRSMAVVAMLGPGAAQDPRRAVVAEDAEGRLTLTMTPAACSDGMSDRAFGLAGMVLREGSGGRDLLAGCCSVAP
jgi:uncharacterized membrane protein